MTARALTFSVIGTPRPKSRPRFVNGRVVTTTKDTERLWRAAVERAAREAVANSGLSAPIFTGAVRTTMRFTFSPRASQRLVGSPHTQRPDKENLEKLVLDAMERAGVYRNDSQVAAGPVEKVWGERPGVSVLVEEIRADETPSVPTPAPAPGWLTST